MKKTLVCSLGLLLLVTAAWSQDGTEKAVAALEQQWLKSQQTNNPDLLVPLHGIFESASNGPNIYPARDSIATLGLGLKLRPTQIPGCSRIGAREHPR